MNEENRNDNLAAAIDIIITRAINTGLKEDYYKATGAVEALRMIGDIPEAFAGLLINLMNESLKKKESKQTGKGRREFRRLWEMEVG